ncbi:hypothetical protein AB0M58_13460 [Streptomyces bobili]|uniref:hypothetical protein n=1 Tax=Streptomyces bobili TaxID=67280 RepID=UPI00341FF0F1
MAQIGAIVLPTSSVVLDDCENPRDLAVGDSLQLQPATGFGGLWIAVQFDDDHSHFALYNAKITTNCGRNSAIACPFHGARHAHPVAIDGRLLRRPTTVRTAR